MRSFLRFGGAIIINGLLTSCLFKEDEPAYPSLDQVKLVGCWVSAKPGGRGNACDEQCFSSKGFYYSRTNTDSSSATSFVEFAGQYSVKENSATLLVKIGNNVEKPDEEIKKIQSSFTIMRDTLFSITNNGQNLNPFVRADSSNTCGPHWQVFPKPDGWDLN